MFIYTEYSVIQYNAPYQIFWLLETGIIQTVTTIDYHCGSIHGLIEPQKVNKPQVTSPNRHNWAAQPLTY